MNYMFGVLFSILLPMFSSLKENPIIPLPKLCINCKFFTNSLFTDSKYGKCSLFTKIEESKADFLVNGIRTRKNKIDYTYCSIARKYDDMCGRNGTKYVDKLSM